VIAAIETEIKYRSDDPFDVNSSWRTRSERRRRKLDEEDDADLVLIPDSNLEVPVLSPYNPARRSLRASDLYIRSLQCQRTSSVS